jgi:hypothetical protein
MDQTPSSTSRPDQAAPDKGIAHHGCDQLAAVAPEMAAAGIRLGIKRAIAAATKRGEQVSAHVDDVDPLGG